MKESSGIAFETNDSSGRHFDRNIYAQFIISEQSPSRDRSPSIEEGLSQAQASRRLQLQVQRRMGGERRVIRGCARGNLRAARAERFGQIDTDPNTFDA